MIVIGERINTTRKSIGAAVEKKDAEFIQNEAKKQETAGAHYIDVNCGTRIKDEVGDMEWLVNTIQEATDLPLCIDSPNHKALNKGLSLVKKKAIVNSITGEKDRIELILPLVKKYKASVVALTMDESGMPESAQQRYDIAARILEEVKKEGVEEEDVYFDLLVRPISTEPKQAVEFLEALRKIKTLGKVNFTCGLSNISFGLPQRQVVNAIFLSMAMANGLNSAIIDPANKLIMASIYTAESILGQDEYCMNYITVAREGKLDI